MENEIVTELFKTIPAVGVAVLALLINKQMMDKWVDTQREISQGMGAILEGLRDLKGK